MMAGPQLFENNQKEQSSFFFVYLIDFLYVFDDPVKIIEELSVDTRDLNWSRTGH